MGKKNYTWCEVQALSADFREPTEEGKQCSVEVKLKVFNCEDPGRNGEEVTEFMSLHPNAQEYTFNNLRALGWTCADVTELTGVGSVRARGGLYVDNYGGKSRTKCGVWPAKTPKPKVTGAAKKSFADQFKAAALAAAVIEKGEHNKALERDELPVQQAQPQQVQAEEDIPF